MRMAECTMDQESISKKPFTQTVTTITKHIIIDQSSVRSHDTWGIRDANKEQSGCIQGGNIQDASIQGANIACLL